MMDIKQKLNEFKGQVIFAGLTIGFLNILGVLPETLGPIGDKTNFFYMAIIALAGYTYWQFHFNSVLPVRGIQRIFPARNISNPRFIKELQRQRGNVNRPQRVPVPQNSQEINSEPSKRIFDTFHED